ncbi:MAG: PfkB family carbohydrate kinase [Acidobacteriota bacterium]
MPVETLFTAIKIAKKAGAIIVQDPSPPNALTDELLHLVDVIKPNKNEAEVLVNISVRDSNTARQAALKLLKRGVGAVAVQAGSEGNLLVWPNGERWLPRYPVKSVDSTGAGDAFAAALGVAMAEGRSFEAAGPFASAAAALTTAIVGVQAALPRRKAVLELIEQSDPEKLIRCNIAA